MPWDFLMCRSLRLPPKRKGKFSWVSKGQESAQNSDSFCEFRRNHWLVIASNRAFPGLWGCCIFLFSLMPCIVLRLVFSQSPRIICQPACHSDRSTQALPPTATHQWLSVSSLMLSSAGNQSTMCVNRKFCHLFMLQSSGRKKYHSLLFIKKKKLAQRLSTGGFKSACYLQPGSAWPKGLHRYYKLWKL